MLYEMAILSAYRLSIAPVLYNPPIEWWNLLQTCMYTADYNLSNEGYLINF